MFKSIATSQQLSKIFGVCLHYVYLLLLILAAITFTTAIWFPLLLTVQIASGIIALFGGVCLLLVGGIISAGLALLNWLYVSPIWNTAWSWIESFWLNLRAGGHWYFNHLESLWDYLGNATSIFGWPGWTVSFSAALVLWAILGLLRLLERTLNLMSGQTQKYDKSNLVSILGEILLVLYGAVMLVFAMFGAGLATAEATKKAAISTDGDLVFPIGKSSFGYNASTDQLELGTKVGFTWLKWF